MEPSFAADGTRAHAAVVNEHEVRAAAGLTMAIGAVAFAYAYFTKQYVPLQVAASLFFAEFLIRVTAGLRYSPIGIVARVLMLGRAPEWVSTKPKRFAWTLGLAMALPMAVITNSGIRGPLPRTICLICLTLMWMESALGLCLGCKIYGLLVRRGWIGTDPAIEVCADGSCERSAQPTSERGTRALSSALGAVSVALAVGVLLVFAAPAGAAAPDGQPVRFWELNKILPTLGPVKLAGTTQTARSTAASPTAEPSLPTSTAVASSAKTSRLTPWDGSLRRDTPPTGATPNWRSCEPTRSLAKHPLVL
jgi:hypothetical protein